MFSAKIIVRVNLLHSSVRKASLQLIACAQAVSSTTRACASVEPQEKYMPVTTQLQTALEAALQNTSKYIYDAMLGRVLNKHIGLNQPTETNPTRIYTGMLHFDGNVFTNYEHVPEIEQPFANFSDVIELYKNNIGIYVLDFAIYDQKRSNGHFTRLSLTIDATKKTILIENFDSLYNAEPQEKNTTLQTEIRNILQSVYTNFTLQPLTIQEQYKAADIQQNGAMCADEVFCALSKLHDKEDVLKEQYADLFGTDTNAKRKAFLRLIGNEYSDKELENLMGSELPSTAAESKEEGKPPAPNPQSTKPESTTVTEKKPEPSAETDTKAITPFDAITDITQKKQVLTEHITAWVPEINQTLAKEGLKITVDSAKITTNKTTAKAVFVVATTNTKPSTKEITLTRTYNEKTDSVQRHCSAGLSWAQQCQIFAASAATERSDHSFIALSDITPPSGASNFPLADQLKGANANKLSNAERTCILFYLQKFESFEYKNTVFTRKDNQSLINKLATPSKSSASPGGFFGGQPQPSTTLPGPEGRSKPTA